MDKQKITESDASKVYGINTDHEKMPNGELRFRLISSDGNNYIRTVASDKGAWQVAHSHSSLRETYIIEKGWMALAERQGDTLEISVYWPSDIVTTRPTIAHNVYLPANAVIHTVKHGSNGQHDWNGESELNAETEPLTEREVLLRGVRNTDALAIDQRFDAYVELYNNLDNLIWQIPGFLAAGAAILIGFAGSALSKSSEATIPPALVAGLFFFVGLLFFLGAFSMARIREHHNMAGDWLAKMEPNGYFHKRRETVGRNWPPSATFVFRYVYYFLCGLFWVLAVMAIFRFQWLTKILKWTS
ncbi:MAG: hypothetical protein DMF64_04880 [Acidobacteria bacterium]|nr:MAG: hypothetical protein DMF64_04880 [Acidobacteriota bacterium]